MLTDKTLKRENSVESDLSIGLKGKDTRKHLVILMLHEPLLRAHFESDVWQADWVEARGPSLLLFRTVNFGL